MSSPTRTYPISQLMHRDRKNPVHQASKLKWWIAAAILIGILIVTPILICLAASQMIVQDPPVNRTGRVTVVINRMGGRK